MRTKLILLGIGCSALLVATCYGLQQQQQWTPGGDSPVWKWTQHDTKRPQPTVIEPGTPSDQDRPGRPPSDAIIVFNGQDLSNWETAKDGSPAGWKVVDGCLEVVKGTGDIRSKQGFGDCQLHVEFREPTPPVGIDQGRG